MINSMDRMFYGYQRDFFKSKTLHVTIRVPKIHKSPRTPFLKSIGVARMRPLTMMQCREKSLALLKKRLHRLENIISVVEHYEEPMWFTTNKANRIHQLLSKTEHASSILYRQTRVYFHQYWNTMRYQGTSCESIFTIDDVFGLHLVLLLFYKVMLKPLSFENQPMPAFVQFCQGIHAKQFPRICSLYKVKEWIDMDSVLFRTEFSKFIGIIVPQLIASTMKRFDNYITKVLMSRST